MASYQRVGKERQVAALADSPVNERRWWLMVVLAVVGIGISAYLSYAYLAEQAILCGESQDVIWLPKAATRGCSASRSPRLAPDYIILLGLLLARRRAKEDTEVYVTLAYWHYCRWRAVFGLSHLSRVVRDSRRVQVVRGSGNSDDCIPGAHRLRAEVQPARRNRRYLSNVTPTEGQL